MGSTSTAQIPPKSLFGRGAGEHKGDQRKGAMQDGRWEKNILTPR